MIRKYKYLILALFICVIIISYYQHLNIGNTVLMLNNLFLTNEKFGIKLESDCSCRQNEKIFMKNNFIVYSSLTGNSYQVTSKELVKNTCALYKTLRRGKHQKVISFSLYGKDKFYYNRLPGD